MHDDSHGTWTVGKEKRLLRGKRKEEKEEKKRKRRDERDEILPVRRDGGTHQIYYGRAHPWRVAGT
jgi:hypothetical protein